MRAGRFVLCATSAAIGVEIKLRRDDFAAAAESDAVPVLERVAFPGRVHVVVFAVDDARRPLRLLRDERGDDGGMRGLTFLPAERAAHPFRHDRDFVNGEPQQMRNGVLHLGGVLRRRVHRELIEFAGDGDRRLRLEVEVVGAAVDPGSFDDVLGGRERGLDVAAPDVPHRSDEEPVPLCLFDGEDRLERLEVDADCALRREHGLARLGADDDDRLSGKRDLVLGDQDLVLEDRPKEVVVQIAVRVEADDSRQGARRLDVERADVRVRERRPEEIDEELVRKRRDVVDVDRLAGHVTDGRIVRDVLADDGHCGILV